MRNPKVRDGGAFSHKSQYFVFFQISGREMQQKDFQTREVFSAAQPESESFTQRNAVFNKEALQVKM